MCNNNKNKIHFGLATIVGCLAFTTSVLASELTFHFNSPSFSGIGWSSHVLTIEQMETNAEDRNRAQTDALRAQAERAAQNSPEAKFVANLESRIYSQLAKQLTDSMFGEGASCTTPGVVCGVVPDLAGNSINWMLGTGSDTGMIVISIQSLSEPSNSTTMKVPAGAFYF
jgi:hypothetical protein